MLLSTNQIKSNQQFVVGTMDGEEQLPRHSVLGVLQVGQPVVRVALEYLNVLLLHVLLRRSVSTYSAPIVRLLISE
jgi:hypothetical protein